MKRNAALLGIAFAVASLFACSPTASAQGNPTALQRRQLSVFAGASFDNTGLSGGKNGSFSGGADLGLLSYHGLRPTIEVRGRYPVDQGQIDGQKDILGGLRLDLLVNHRFHPYVDGLAGRGSTNYPNGYLYNNFAYDLTTNFVYAGGGGVDLDLTDHFVIKLDGQYEHWGAAPNPSGSIGSTVATVGVVLPLGLQSPLSPVGSWFKGRGSRST